MIRASLVFAALLLLGGHAGATEPHTFAPTGARGAEELFSAMLTQRTGLAEAPFVTAAFPEVSGFGVVLSGTARLKLPPLGWAHLTLPVSFVRLDFPAGAQEPESALGNLELGLEHELDAPEATRFALLGALIAPTAAHGSKSALLDNRALALASALNGGKDAALLTPGVIGVRVRPTVERALRPFELRASLDLPLLVRISDASLPEESETHAVGISPALDLGAALWITPWFGASLGGGLIFDWLRVQEPALEGAREQRLQTLVEPGFDFRLGQHIELGLEASVPVGGALGGDAWSIALEGRLGL